MFLPVKAPFKICAIAAAWLSGCSVPLVPLTEAEVDAAATRNLSAVVADQEPVRGPIGLYEAIARSLKYNLDYRVEAVQTSLRVAELDLSHYNLLPNAVVSSGYAARDKYSASSSLNLVTDEPNFGASTSQDKRIRTADIQFSWNILDFGLSYVRARQASDKVLIGEELKRKVMQRIVEDVRSAFWRAVSAERLTAKMRSLEARVGTALANARSVSASRETSAVTSLTYERELVEIRRAIKELQRDLIVAKSQLAALMNLTPGQPYSLVTEMRAAPPARIKLPLDDAIGIAIRNRPELLENLYQQRINVHESHAALLEMLPGLQAYAGPNIDSNSFLLNSDWVSWGAKASWNLLKVFSYPARREVVEMNGELLQARALALTMAVMTQVHVSRIRYLQFASELDTSAQFRSVQNRLVEQIRAEAAADRVSEQTLIREELNALIGEAKYDIAYASMQSALANVYASMGLDLHYGDVDPSMSIGQIANSVRQSSIEQGRLNSNLQTAHAQQ